MSATTRPGQRRIIDSARADRGDLLVHRERDADHAVEDAYRHHASVVWSRACSICGPDHASDVVQEVFIRLWRAPEKFDPTRGSLRTYLLVLTRGVSVDLIRSDHRRRAREDRHGRELGAGAWQRHQESEHGLLAPLLADEARRRVTEALAELAGGQRRAIETIYFDGLSFVEGAARTGLPEGTIKTRVHAALQQLRPLLADLADLAVSAHEREAAAVTPLRAGDRSSGRSTATSPGAAPPSSRRRRQERLAAALGAITSATLDDARPRRGDGGRGPTVDRPEITAADVRAAPWNRVPMTPMTPMEVMTR